MNEKKRKDRALGQQRGRDGKKRAIENCTRNNIDTYYAVFEMWRADNLNQERIGDDFHYWAQELGLIELDPPKGSHSSRWAKCMDRHNCEPVSVPRRSPATPTSHGSKTQVWLIK